MNESDREIGGNIERDRDGETYIEIEKGLNICTHRKKERMRERQRQRKRQRKTERYRETDT